MKNQVEQCLSSHTQHTVMRILLITILLLTGFLIVSCSNYDEEQELFERRAYSLPAGFTRTDIEGRVINGQEDPEDWQISPLYEGLVYLRSDQPAAFPNPVTAADYVHISLEVRLDALSGYSVRSVYDRADIADRLHTIIHHSPIQDGFYEIRFPAVEINPDNPDNMRGLHRIIILDRNNRVITYGDVMFE